MSEKFEVLLASFCADVEDENVNSKRLKLGLKGVIRQPTTYVDNETMDISESNDIAGVLLAITSHCKFFNFKLLEKLIKFIKYHAGDYMMEEYKRDFNGYVQAILVSEIPHGIGMDSEDCEFFCVELDESFKSCRAFNIDILKVDLCKILHIKEECLYIAITNVLQFSLRIIFQINVLSIRNECPFQEENIKAMNSLVYENAKILRVGYDGKVYDVNTDNSEGMNCEINSD